MHQNKACPFQDPIHQWQLHGKSKNSQVDNGDIMKACPFCMCLRYKGIHTWCHILFPITWLLLLPILCWHSSSRKSMSTWEKWEVCKRFSSYTEWILQLFSLHRKMFLSLRNFKMVWTSIPRIPASNIEKHCLKKGGLLYTVQ